MNIVDRVLVAQRLINDINEILRKYGITDQVALSDFHFTDRTFSDLVKPEAKLSKILTEHLWPSVSSKVIFHYTSKEAAEAILSTGLFRLNNITGRYHEGEIETFCRTHELDGYLELDEVGKPKYKELLMRNIYYASFTDINISEQQEEYFWRNFASNDGVRLRLKVSDKGQNFRKIFYEHAKGKQIDILNEISRKVRERTNLEFILKGISQLCAFYLSQADYGIENEYRALIVDRKIQEKFPGTPANKTYIEHSLGDESQYGLKIEILDVHSREKPTMPSDIIFSKRELEPI